MAACNDEEFEAACKCVRSLAGKLSKEDLLYFYARYKMVTEGVCKAPKPAFYQLSEKSKWQAWTDLGDMDREKAREQYLDRLEKIDPDWILKEARDPTSGWVSVSCPSQEEDEALSEEDKTIFDWTKEGRMDKLKAVLSDENVLERDGEGLTVLHWAADRGLTAIAKHILGINPDIINIQDNEGQTALHFASSCGHVELVKLLLEAGADPSILDSDGRSPEANGDRKIKQLFQSVRSTAGN